QNGWIGHHGWDLLDYLGFEAGLLDVGAAQNRPRQLEVAHVPHSVLILLDGPVGRLDDARRLLVAIETAMIDRARWRTGGRGIFHFGYLKKIGCCHNILNSLNLIHCVSNYSDRW